MNESAPATLRVPVPWWERLVAGVLAAGWVGVVFWLTGGVAGWWEEIRETLSGIGGIWQHAIQSGDVEKFAQPDSHYFALGLWLSCLLGFQLGIVWLIGAGLWVAGGRGGRPLRTVFWLSVLGQGFVGLGSLAAEGRYWHLLGFHMGGSAIHPPLWHGGWLSYLGGDDGMEKLPFAIACVFHILLGGLMLWLGWRRGRRGKADNALAAGGAEGTGSRA